MIRWRGKRIVKGSPDDQIIRRSGLWHCESCRGILEFPVEVSKWDSSIDGGVFNYFNDCWVDLRNFSMAWFVWNNGVDLVFKALYCSIGIKQKHFTFILFSNIHKSIIVFCWNKLLVQVTCSFILLFSSISQKVMKWAMSHQCSSTRSKLGWP